MPIRIICHAKWRGQQKYFASQGLRSFLAEYLKASYADPFIVVYDELEDKWRRVLCC